MLLECEREDGTRHGPFVGVFAGDRKYAEGAYLDGKPHGVWRRWEGGSLVFEGEFDNGIPDGRFRYWRDGKLIEDFRIDNGTGVYVELDGSGEVVARSELRNGKRHGTRTLYEAGHKIAEETWRDGLAHGVFRRWQTDGTPLGEFAMVDGTGTMIEWWSPGDKRSEVEYRAGLKNGRETTWHPNGNKAAEGHNVDDERDGEWVGWDLEGNETFRCQYRAGQRNGRCRETAAWYGQRHLETVTLPHGELPVDEAEGEYRDGMREGEWVERLDGERVGEGSYAAGKRSGTWKFWKGSEPWAEGEYGDGLPNGPWTLHFYHRFTGVLRNGKKHGAWIKWSPSGEKLSETHFDNGKEIDPR